MFGRNEYVQGLLLEGRFTKNKQPNDPISISEGHIYEFSKFYVLHNSRQRKLTHLPYYILIDQETNVSEVMDVGQLFSVQIFYKVFNNDVYSTSKILRRCCWANTHNTTQKPLSSRNQYWFDNWTIAEQVSVI